MYLLADTNDVAARLAGRVRDQLVAAGQVDDSRTVTLGDGNRVGVGDQIVTRDNDRLNVSGDGRFAANRDLWRVTAVSEAGGLSVARDDSGEVVELDPGYVADRVQLAYAGTVHSAQGGTRDVAHAIITDRSTRTGAYVALTRGRRTTPTSCAADPKAPITTAPWSTRSRFWLGCSNDPIRPSNPRP